MSKINGERGGGVATYEAHVHIPAEEVVARLLPQIQRQLAEVEVDARRAAEQTVRDREHEIRQAGIRYAVEAIAREIEHGYGLTGELDETQLVAADCRRMVLRHLPAAS